jgi:hypothetical protein
MNTRTQELHWLVVGYVSPGARSRITEVGGRVIDLSSNPPLVAVALAYNPTGVWVWNHGRQEHRQGIEFWNTGEVQEASTGITLQYRNIDPHTSTEYSSVETNYLILPDETFDPQTRHVQEPDNQTQSASADGENEKQDQEQPVARWPPDDGLDLLDEAPF